jgi:ATP-dependent helicase/DNAse subunit B
MAEHVRNELARKSLPIRPSRILTLAKFVEPFTPHQEAPDALVHLLIAQCDLSKFGAVASLPGFHRSIASLLGQVADLPSDLARIAYEVNHQLSLRGYALREWRLRTAQPVATGPIILDGFFTFSPSDLALIEKLAAQTSITVTLPDWPGSASARSHLLSIGFTEQRFDLPLRHAQRAILASPTLEQEVEQIALRILDHAGRGREFREMGILLRVRDPYASALESTLDRFGIPARFHFADALSAHPAIQYLAGLVRVVLNGWDHAQLLPLLRMPISGIGATPEGDALDFSMRESLPATGQVPDLPSAFRALAGLERDRQTPTEWSANLKTLRALIPTPEITDHLDHRQIQILRSTAQALNAFDAILDTTALALNDTKIKLAKFWPHVEAALDVEKLRIPDRRRNVVNVLDVYEARQWELPIVFVCGLNERHFPQYHRQDPLLADAARAADRQLEERFLFELATTRATEETILSYARFNDKGDAQLRSFFLEEEGRIAGNPRPLPVPDARSFSNPAEQLQALPERLSPTAIESFLQCPFQFFARRTLKLRQRPPKPRDRLDMLLQGSILHQALAEGDFDRVFKEACDKSNIPPTYRKEAVRLELLRHFEAFQADRQWPLDWPRRTEEKFVVALTPRLSISGRIDRLDIGPKNEAIVIDYKYSAAARIRERMESDPIQGGLYLLAAERFFNLQPAGMFYCGLRQSVTWDGWHLPLPGLNIGEARASLRELISGAEQKAIEVFESVQGGNIEVRPADRNKCRYCDFNEICRIETSSQQPVAAGSSCPA